MDLEQFVSTSLMQIINGVKKAQEETKNSGAWINPAGTGLPPDASIQTREGVWAYLHNVEFDVAVTAADSKGGEAGAGLQVGTISLGAKREKESRNSTVSRIIFSVPVVWPSSVREAREQNLKRQT